MDAKSRMNFINSTASGQKKQCPKCSSLNTNDAKNCAVCGASFEQVKVEANVENVSFVQTKNELKPEKKVENKPEKQTMSKVQNDKQGDVFAQGLPEWSIEPPQVMVRRKKH